MAKCDADIEVYSRVVGYYRPTRLWNKGAKAAFKSRVYFAAELDTAEERARDKAISDAEEKTKKMEATNE